MSLEPQALGPQTWAEFYLAHRRALTAYALSLTGNVPDAHDLIQDVLVRVIRLRTAPDNAKAFVLRCLRNAALDRRRAARTSRERLRPRSGVLFDDAGTDLALRETMTRVEAAIEGLADTQREVVVLKIYAEMTFSEIAELMDAPLGTITSHYARAVAALRQALNVEGSHAHR